jgi:hypothetical protein
MSDIQAEGGRDATDAVVEELGKNSKKLAREAMDVWFAKSQDRIVEAAQHRATQGSTHQQQENNLTDLLDEFQPPHWDENRGAWVFSVTHDAAVFHEFGAMPHEIEARQAQVLAFEWRDAPEEVQEMFESTFPTVFFQSVNHPGVPGIGYLRYGRDEARRRLEKSGFDASEFGVEK